MPRMRTYGDVFDEVWQIDIAWLRGEGLFEPNRRVEGWPLHWKCGKRVTVDVDTSLCYMRIRHGTVDDPKNYIIRLHSRTSNLGKGIVWYFICPATGRLCRKLYQITGVFRSRHTCRDIVYRSQTEPKSDRRLRNLITLNGTLKNPKAEWDFSDRKHYRTHYKGVPTKRYLRYLERIRGIRALVESGVGGRADQQLKKLKEKFDKSFPFQCP